MVPESWSLSFRSASRGLSVLAFLAASASVTALLFPNPLADAFFAGSMLFIVLLTFVGGIGAWTTRPPLIWVPALLLTALSIIATVGRIIAPAAILLLAAALCSQLAGPRRARREKISADPPPRSEVRRKTVAGIVSVAVGAGFVYVGAFAQELFGACANETLACAIETTHWDAVGLTVLGLVGITVGGWLVWKQVYISRVLSVSRTG